MYLVWFLVPNGTAFVYKIFMYFHNVVRIERRPTTKTPHLLAFGSQYVQKHFLDF